jgi:hypothetical protein
MARFQRETATNEADLPHEFAGYQQVCDTCMMLPADARHKAWERQELAERERAGLELKREIGS